jgi:malate synthase
VLDDGRKVTKPLARQLLREEAQRLPHGDSYRQAAKLLEDLITSDEYLEFLTLPAYDLLMESGDAVETSEQLVA